MALQPDPDLRYQLVIFDWDGTLIDSATNIVASIEKTAEDMGLAKPSKQQILSLIGLKFDKLLEQLVPQLDSQQKNLFRTHYRQNYIKQQANNHSQLFPGVIDVLKQLKSQDYLIAIATSKHRIGLERDLDYFQLQSLISTSKCGDEAASKPNPQMINDILAYLDIDKAKAIMVGDTPYDLQMAQSAGVHAVGVTSGTGNKQHLLACQPNYCLSGVSELPVCLNLS